MDMVYKNFGITKVKEGKWQILLSGKVLRTCKTKKECKERIDKQTV